MNRINIDTPLGPMMIAAGQEGLWGAWFLDQRHFPAEVESWPCRRSELLDRAKAQIEGYLAGELAVFDLPLAPRGTPFQRAVWEHLRAIPYGQSASYGLIARAMAQPSGARAVGMAVGRNPWSLIVPCHRVIASTGALTGYAGGLERKRRLLAMEQTSGAGGPISAMGQD